MSKFKTILKECYRRNIKSGAFIAMVVLPIIFFVIIQFVGGYIGNQQKEAAYRPVGILTQDTNLLNRIKALNTELSLVDTKDEADALAKLESNDIFAYVTIEEKAGKIHAQLYRKASSDKVDTTKLSQVLTGIELQNVMAEHRVDAQVAQTLLQTHVSISSNRLDEESLKEGIVKIQDEGDQKESLRQIIAYGAIFFLYIMLSMYMSIIGQEIASEKGTRMMEIILSSTDAKTHFLGKLCGISLVVVTQIGIYAILGVVAWFVFDGATLLNTLLGGINLWEVAGDMLVYTGIFALLGTILFTVISGVCGSMVSKVEDVQKVMLPLVLFLVVGFYIGMFGMIMPNNIVVRVASFIPILSPFIVPFRVASSSIQVVELFSIMGLTIAFTILVLYLGMEMYKANVLIYSDKGPLQVIKQGFTLMKSERKRNNKNS
ncbi:hypothetical protein GMA11_06715 [Granulicatella sp. zg-ZJ]|uniref:ABC transporter permease n=1 Tax=unclassified Granulicatella TaxID=2630493 RepID=UPI0013C14661|nr:MULTISPECIES: ABC transporter permease [unclassified Granulicatella]MBS4749991.1 ABC transporter permease [Carnobacteriaceae bacterium zg-ZUI78]NEW63085.1 hypothetical protein [Granulicatella sp. zg-ZJ]NEW66189.1 hypothetical protein [Granulicatella sp. zg-84]QMI86054.1 ABC transporter permease [Carnobacteriaceae bacterium zg-84]